ncbi:hypothetical protein Tco_0939720 [Tanacetum coccineum]|uniref:Uncharacterized protein n=1 Tax=Tanacetum coccineum TaxID=301880 RepID=A0ABQ5DKY9_9ASTR
MLINILFCFAVIFPILRIKHELLNLLKNLFRYSKLDIHNEELVLLVDLPIIRFEDLQERRHREVEEMCFVMGISVILVLSNSSEESVGTPTGRVILFGTIHTPILDTTPTVTPPATNIDTTLIPTEIHTFDPSEDPSSDHIPSLPATSPFLSSTDDSSDNETPDTPPSPTLGTPFTEITLST